MSDWLWQVRLVLYSHRGGDDMNQREDDARRVAQKLRDVGLRASKAYISVVVIRRVYSEHANDALSAMGAAIGTIYNYWPEGEKLPWQISSASVKQVLVEDEQ